MSRLALRGAGRRLLVRLHRWSGLTILAFLTVAALTGSYLAFRSEFDRWLNPAWMTVSTSGPRLPLETIMADVEAEYPEAMVSTVYAPDDARETYSVYLKARSMQTAGHQHGMSSPSGLPVDQVFVNPHTGQVLGGRDTSRNVISRANLGHFMLRLHYKLLAGDAGEWVLGICALVWFLTAFVGVALAWPAYWRRLASWKPVAGIRLKGGSYKTNYDLHRSLSVVLLPAWLVLAFSSVYLNLPGLVKPSVNRLSPLTVAPTAPPRSGTGPFTVTADRAVAVALDAVPGAELYSVTRDAGKGWYSVRLRRPDDPSPLGNNYAYVDGYTGRLSASTTARDAGWGDHFIFWQFPLHSGMAFGLPGQAVVFALGLVFTVTSVSGLYIWWVGFRLRVFGRRASSRRSSAGPMERVPREAV